MQFNVARDCHVMTHFWPPSVNLVGHSLSDADSGFWDRPSVGEGVPVL